jgi:propanediol dehydratase large subunit
VPRILTAALAAVALVASASACRGESNTAEAPKAFCKAARHYEQVAQRQKPRNGQYTTEQIDRQIQLVEAIVEHAPRAIAEDAKTFLDALRRVKTDESVRDDPAIKKAVDNVNRYAAQGCGIYARDGL